MRSRASCRCLAIATVGVLVAASAAFSASPTQGSLVASEAGAGHAGQTQVFVVQAMPGATYDVSIDGESVGESVEEGAVLGPFEVAAGGHDVVFAPHGDGSPTTSSVSIAVGSSTDVVLHRPAARNGDPVLSVYAAPMKPIGPGKARVLLAHTATVPPADVRVDGQVVFTNIANGEYAQADLPAGRHSVSLLPSGQSADPLLGPVAVHLPARTITLVYAVGTPRNGSMDVISHRERLSSDGSVAPSRIDTGAAGLVARSHVDAFLG